MYRGISKVPQRTQTPHVARQVGRLRDVHSFGRTTNSLSKDLRITWPGTCSGSVSLRRNKLRPGIRHADALAGRAGFHGQGAPGGGAGCGGAAAAPLTRTYFDRVRAPPHGAQNPWVTPFFTWGKLRASCGPELLLPSIPCVLPTMMLYDLYRKIRVGYQVKISSDTHKEVGPRVP